MGNYLRLLGDDLVAAVLDKVADLHEEDILRIEKKINRIKNKIGLSITKGYIKYGSVFLDSRMRLYITIIAKIIPRKL
jgi:hypothetical protein